MRHFSQVKSQPIPPFECKKNIILDKVLIMPTNLSFTMKQSQSKSIQLKQFLKLAQSMPI